MKEGAGGCPQRRKTRTLGGGAGSGDTRRRQHRARFHSPGPCRPRPLLNLESLDRVLSSKSRMRHENGRAGTWELSVKKSAPRVPAHHPRVEPQPRGAAAPRRARRRLVLRQCVLAHQIHRRLPVVSIGRHRPVIRPYRVPEPPPKFIFQLALCNFTREPFCALLR